MAHSVNDVGSVLQHTSTDERATTLGASVTSFTKWYVLLQVLSVVSSFSLHVFMYVTRSTYKVYFILTDCVEKCELWLVMCLCESQHFSLFRVIF